MFRREAAYFVPDFEFVPYFWRRKGDDVDSDDDGDASLEDIPEGSLDAADRSG